MLFAFRPGGFYAPSARILCGAIDFVPDRCAWMVRFHFECDSTRDDHNRGTRARRRRLGRRRNHDLRWRLSQHRTARQRSSPRRSGAATSPRSFHGSGEQQRRLPIRETVKRNRELFDRELPCVHVIRLQGSDSPTVGRTDHRSSDFRQRQRATGDRSPRGIGHQRRRRNANDRRRNVLPCASGSDGLSSAPWSRHGSRTWDWQRRAVEGRPQSIPAAGNCSDRCRNRCGDLLCV